MKLETEGLTKHFGGVVALEDVSLEFVGSMVTAVIGPNGAGKTTLVGTMTGFVRPDSGRIWATEGDGDAARDVELVGRRPHEIARHGVGVLFQDIRVFPYLTVLENVAVGMRDQLGEHARSAFVHPRRTAKSEKQTMERAHGYLEFVGLADRAAAWAGHLSYGQQKLVAIARLLASDAGVLVLDEPTAGLHPDMIAKLLGLIRQLAAERHKAVIMVEHNLHVVREVGDWVYLMAAGRVEVYGTPREVLRDDTLQAIFPAL